MSIENRLAITIQTFSFKSEPGMAYVASLIKEMIGSIIIIEFMQNWIIDSLKNQ